MQSHVMFFKSTIRTMRNLTLTGFILWTRRRKLYKSQTNSKINYLWSRLGSITWTSDM